MIALERILLGAALTFLVAGGARNVAAAGIGVSLTSDVLPSQPVASTSHWDAAAASADLTSSGLQYQFSVSPIGGVPNVLRSFHASNSFEWTPMVEGVYKVTVAVRDPDGNTGEASAALVVTSRLTQPDTPAVSATANPLVALYSAPACGDGSVRAIVHPKANLAKQYSQYRKCVDGKTFNFLMAGMLPKTQYVLQQEWTSPGQSSQFGPEITFTTGAIPDSANLPAAVVLNPRDSATDAAQPVLLTSYIATLPGQSATPVATDFRGRTIWYYGVADKPLRYVLRPLAGGTILAIPRDPT
ncbi:MAG: hypothetical protein M3Z85_20300, partial [Acidobacteriota bacterium]|nr:hypothetical protein [Acidobacteriota bacterium]